MAEGCGTAVSTTCDSGRPVSFQGPFAGDVRQRTALPDHPFPHPNRRLMKRNQQAEDAHASHLSSTRGLSIYTMP